MQQDEWSDDEFLAAVRAYLELLNAQNNGELVQKADVRRRLREGPLSKRSDASIEYRMQNISAVMELQGRAFIRGYPPARNVGARGTRIISSLIDDAYERTSARNETEDHANQPRRPRIFVTGMWGFDSSREGYVGFTNENIRDRLMNDYEPGDLMVIVGQRGEFSEEKDVGRLLGLVELDPVPIHESARMSPEAYAEKVSKFGSDRWQYALPIKRAWKIRWGVRAANILPTSYEHKYARSVGASYRELTADEVGSVLSLPVKAAKVWGVAEQEGSGQDGDAELTVSEALSRGPKPWFGASETVRTDGETKLYLMKLVGCVDSMFPKLRPNASQKVIIKVGRSNDPRRRVSELNIGFPPSADLKWELAQVQNFKTADEAHVAEQKLLTELDARSLSLGAEFAVIPTREISTLLTPYAGSSAFYVKASSGLQPRKHSR